MSSSRLEAQAETASPETDPSVDWETIFDEWDGKYIPRDLLWKQVVFASDSNVSEKDEAQAAIKEAKDRGRLVQKPKGYRLSVGVNEESSKTQTPDNGGSTVHPVVQDLRENAEDTDEYVTSVESTLSTVLRRLDDIEERQAEVESRVENVEEQDENREQRVNKIFRSYNEVRTGLTEMQLRRLKDGELLSADAVDIDALEDMGYDPIIVGDNRDAVRLPAHEQDDGDSGNSRDLPDFNQLCTLEELRVKKKLKLVTRQDIENDSAYKFRGMVVWDDAGLLNVSDSNDELSIPSSKIREKLMKIEDIKKESSYEIAKRTMRKMTPETADEKDGNWSDGVFRFDDSGNENRIVADVEDLRDATVQRFSTSAVAGEGGESNTVVR